MKRIIGWFFILTSLLGSNIAGKQEEITVTLVIILAFFQFQEFTS